MANEYATSAELKARLGITDSQDDSVIAAVLAAVSREIDDWTGRRFYAASETRYYTADSSELLWLDDVLSISSLATDEAGDRTYATAWSASYYDLEPYNAALQGKPYSRLRARTGAFPLTHRGVKVIGSFGYASTTPPVIKEACLIQSSRIFRRRDAPLGVVGAPDIGQIILRGQLDPDVKVMIQPYRLISVG